MIKSLVTGGAGFIGSHVVNYLIDLKHDVTVIDDLSGGFAENVHSKATFIQATITDATFIDQLFEKNQFTYVYHMAAYAAEGLSHFIRNYNYQNNLIGSVNLINASVKYNIKCFVFTSSIAVYGAQSPPMSETLTPLPEDPYAIAKYAIELDLKCAHEQFGLDYIVFRPHNVYGPNQNIGDHYRNVIGIFMNQLLQGKELTVFGDGNQCRAFSFIDDVAPYIAKSVNYPEAFNEIINIGTNTHHSVLTLAKETMKAMGIEEAIQFLPKRNEVMHAYADHGKSQELFGIKDRETMPLEMGLKLMAKWVRKIGARKTSTFQSIELTNGIPSVWLEKSQ